MSPIETHCSNIDYFPTIENGSETEESTRLHLARGVIALFVLSFFAVICAFFTGLSGKVLKRQTFHFISSQLFIIFFTGCWRRSAGAITATAILMLTACLLASGAMGLWHTVEFFEKEKVVGDEYFQTWPNVSCVNCQQSLRNNIKPLFVIDFARQHTYLIRLVIHCCMGCCCLQINCRHSLIWSCCLSQKRTREGRTAEPSISDASLPTETTRLRLPTLPTTSLSPTGFLWLTVWTSTRSLQLLKRTSTG